MKNWLLALFAIVALPLSLRAADLSGTWTLDINPDFGGLQSVVECAFTQDGDGLTANCGDGAAPITGTVKGQVVTFLVKTGLKNEYTATFTGALTDRDSAMAGTWILTDGNGTREGKFSGHKR